MSDRDKSTSRPVPASVWWTFITLAYMWGYQEGRQFGQLEGYSRAVKSWVTGYTQAFR